LKHKELKEKKKLALDDLSMKKRFHWSKLQLLPCPPANCNNHSNHIYKTKSTNIVKREPSPTINLLKTLHLILRHNENVISTPCSYHCPQFRNYRMHIYMF